MEHRRWHDAYDAGVPHDLVIVERTLPAALARAVATRPGAPALWFQNRRMGYAELGDQVDRLATAFARLGVRAGTRVAIQLPNMPQAVIAYFATLRLGAIAVMTSPLFVAREIEHQWHDAGIEVAVVTDYLWAHRLRAIRGRLPARHYVVASIPEYLAFPLSLLAPLKLRRADPPLIADVPREPGVVRFRDLVRSAPPQPPGPGPAMDDIATLQYTGGTTGVSKGAILTHRNLSANCQAAHHWLHVPAQSDEVVLAALPLFHVFGMTIAMNLPVWVGGTIVLVPNPREMKSIVDAVIHRRITLFLGVPAMFSAIARMAANENLDLRSIRTCISGSAPLPADVLERFEALTGARIVEGFGLTEASPVTHCNPLRSVRKIRSIGIPFTGTDARIVDLETGTRVLPTGEEGELCVRGPQVMRGYWNRPGDTAVVLRDGWLHTGDIAYMDGDGYFFIAGRKKDMIIVAGSNVYPDEVDHVLQLHPAVLESATIGVPDAVRGEHVKSFVVLRPGARATPRELVDHCRENLAPYKVPRRIEFRAELPRNGVLKVLRRELREQELVGAER